MSQAQQQSPLPHSPPADKPISSMQMLERTGGAAPPAPERMPVPDHRCRLPMRDGVRLDTHVWLPGGSAPSQHRTLDMITCRHIATQTAIATTSRIE